MRRGDPPIWKFQTHPTVPWSLKLVARTVNVGVCILDCMSKNPVSKNVEAQIWPYFGNIVVISLLAISISFPASNEIYRKFTFKFSFIA